MAAKKPAPMFYVVTRALADAMRTGRGNPRGTVYGVFASIAAAERFRETRKLGLCTTIVEQ